MLGLWALFAYTATSETRTQAVNADGGVGDLTGLPSVTADSDAHGNSSLAEWKGLHATQPLASPGGLTEEVSRSNSTSSSPNIVVVPSAGSKVAMSNLKKAFAAQKRGQIEDTYALQKKFSRLYNIRTDLAYEKMKYADDRRKELEGLVKDGSEVVGKEHAEAQEFMDGVPKAAAKFAKKTMKGMKKNLKKFTKADKKNLKKYAKKDVKMMKKIFKTTRKFDKVLGKVKKKAAKKLAKLEKMVVKHTSKTRKKFIKQQTKQQGKLFDIMNKLLEEADETADLNVETGEEVQQRNTASQYLLENGLTGLNVVNARAEQKVEQFEDSTAKEIASFVKKAALDLREITARVVEDQRKTLAASLSEAGFNDRSMARFAMRADIDAKKLRKNFVNQVAVANQVISIEKAFNVPVLVKLKAASKQLHGMLMTRDAFLASAMRGIQDSQDDVHSTLMARTERDFGNLFQYLKNMALTVDGFMGVKAAEILASGISRINRIRIKYEAMLADVDGIAVKKHLELGLVIEKVRKILGSRDGVRQLHKELQKHQDVPNQLEDILDETRKTGDRLLKEGRRKAFVEQVRMGLAAKATAEAMQQTEGSAAVGLGEARGDMGEAIIKKSTPLMGDIIMLKDDMTSSSNRIKGLMVEADETLTASESRLSDMEKNVSNLDSKITLAQQQFGDATKDGNIRTGMMQTGVDEFTGQKFGDELAEGMKSIAKDETVLHDEAAAWDSDSHQSLKALKHEIKNTTGGLDKGWANIQAVAITQQQMVGISTEATVTEGMELAGFTSDADKEIEQAESRLAANDAESKAAAEKALQGVEAKGKEDEMLAKSGLSGVLGAYIDKVTRMSLATTEASTLQEKKISSASKAAKKVMMLNLQDAMGGLSKLDTQMEFLAHLAAGHSVEDAMALAKAGVEAAASSGKGSSRFAANMVKAKDGVSTEVLKAINLLRFGPGGIEERMATFKKTMAKGISDMDANALDEKKAFHDGLNEENALADETLAKMDESTLKMKSFVNSATGMLGDKRMTVKTKLASLEADVDGRMKNAEAGIDFASSSVAKSQQDLTDQTRRLEDGVKQELTVVDVLKKNTERSLGGVMEGLSTAKQKAAADANIAKLKEHENKMMERLTAGVTKASDLVDNLFAEFSTQLQFGANKLVPLRGVVADQRATAKNSFDQLAGTINNDESVVSELISGTNEVGEELDRHVQARHMVLNKRLGDLKAKLATLLGATTYQKSGMLQKTASELTDALDVSRVMADHIKTMVEPQEKKWRTGISDLMQTAEMTEEEQMMDAAAHHRQKTVATDPQAANMLNERLSREVEQRHRNAMLNLRGLEEQQESQMHSSLGKVKDAGSVAVHAEQQLRDRMSTSKMGTLEKTRELIQDQHEMDLSTTRHRQDLQTAMDRGANQAEWEGMRVDAPHRTALTKQADLQRKRLDALHQSLLEMPGSLLETRDESQGVARAGDFRAIAERLRDLGHSRDTEDAQWDAGLERMEATVGRMATASR